jgi:hypothetical protein
VKIMAILADRPAKTDGAERAAPRQINVLSPKTAASIAASI